MNERQTAPIVEPPNGDTSVVCLLMYFNPVLWHHRTRATNIMLAHTEWTVCEPHHNQFINCQMSRNHLRFLTVGRSKLCFMPALICEWNFMLRALLSAHAASNCVVSWSTKCVYFVRPERPKFFTYTCTYTHTHIWKHYFGFRNTGHR